MSAKYTLNGEELIDNFDLRDNMIAFHFEVEAGSILQVDEIKRGKVVSSKSTTLPALVRGELTPLP